MTTNAGDIIRVAARHKWNSVSDIVNVFHFTVTTEPAVPADSDLLADVSEHLSVVYTTIQAAMSTSVQQEDITVYNVIDDYPLGAVNWSGGYAGGTGTGDSLPPGTSALILARTATKRVLGKIYLPPFMETYQDGGIWPSLTLNLMIDFFDAIRTSGPLTHGYELTYGVWSSDAGQMRPITAFNARPVVAYQRRRRPGTGS